MHEPELESAAEPGVNAQCPSVPPKLQASLVVYVEQAPLGIQLNPFDTHEGIVVSQAIEVVFLISWQALTLQDFIIVVSVDPRGISHTQTPSVPSMQPSSKVYVEQAAKGMQKLPLLVHFDFVAN